MPTNQAFDYYHRQLGIKMSIDLMDKDEINKRLEELRKTTANLQPVSNLRTNRYSH